MTWREYHESTKHTVQSLRRSQHFLDWKNMPDPFRHYEGAPVLDLPPEPPGPEIPTLELLEGAYGITHASDGPRFLCELLFHSAAISASKLIPSTGDRYALRVNPSSGNLHPTEFHFVTRGLKAWPDGLYHYRPSSHMVEQRATGDLALKLGDPTAPITFILTSIAWREAWKYRDRAYRYCLHDVGHAWQALALASRACGRDSFAIGRFPDDEISRGCRLSEDEWPMLVVEIRGRSIPLGDPNAEDTVWCGGLANQLSEHQVSYPLIDAMHAATKSNSASELEDLGADEGAGEIALPLPASSKRPFSEAARMRRSALDFRGGAESMSLAQLSALLSAASQPLSADFAGSHFVQLFLYAHRVDDLAPGVYRYWPRHHQL
jgi:SagB-type dehydrogenase family enzyme